jgi:hypothetical protein
LVVEEAVGLGLGYFTIAIPWHFYSSTLNGMVEPLGNFIRRMIYPEDRFD